MVHVQGTGNKVNTENLLVCFIDETFHAKSSCS